MLAVGYVTGTVAPDILGVDQAVKLNEGLTSDPGALVLALAPHLIGSFFGLVLLSVAAWRSRAFPRPAVALLVAFLVWDFVLAPIGPLEPHLLLAVAWGWMGWHMIRMPDAQWRGERMVDDGV